MGAYSEFIYKSEINKELEINLKFDAKKFRKCYRRKPSKPSYFRGGSYTRPVPNFDINIKFNYNTKSNQIELARRDVIFENGITENVLYDSEKEEYSVTIENDSKGESFVIPEVKLYKFYDYRPIFKAGFDKIHEKYYEHIRTQNIASLIDNVFNNLFYLGPLRDFPKRLYSTSGQAPRDVGIRGERSIDVLRFSGTSSYSEARMVKEEVEKWFTQFKIADDINLEQIVEGIYYMVYITDSASKARVNLADIGFGASQTLPIIIECFYAPPGSTLLIEQPEIHLHPKAQSILGDLFIEATQKSDRTFIIETHSEHILARIRRRLAESNAGLGNYKISRDDIAIYYFEPTMDGTQVKEVTLNEQGQYVEFPDGFFEEDLDEAIEHLKAMKGSDCACQ